MRKDNQLLLAIQRHGPFPGEDLDALDSRVIGRAVRHALCDPTDQQFIIIGVGVETLPAAMWQRRSALEEQKTVSGRGGEKPPAARLFDQVLIILGGFKSQQREAEPILAAGLAM